MIKIVALSGQNILIFHFQTNYCESEDIETYQ